MGIFWKKSNYKKLGGVGDLSRSTRLEVLFPLLLLLLFVLSARFSWLLLVLALLLSFSLRGDRFVAFRWLPPPPPPTGRFRGVGGGGVEERSWERDRDRECERDLSRCGGVFERERLRLFDLINR